MKKLHLLLMLFTAVLFISCITEDDVPETKVRAIRVKAVALLATEFPSSEGNVLEVYGFISTKFVVLNKKNEERILWIRDPLNWEPVGRAETMINSADAEQIFLITDEDIQNEASLEFYAKMWDKDPDGNPDDYLGETVQSFQIGNRTNITFKDKIYPIQIRLRQFDGITLLVRFTVEYLYD